MFNANNFFRERFASHMKETSRYLKYIFNGHIAVAMLFFISALAYYYQQWLEELPEDFPAALIIGMVFGVLAAYSPVRTLLKEPDLVFLLPAEQKLGAYFRNTLFYSFVIQLYLLFLAMAALAPLYFAAFPARSGSSYFWTALILLLMKIWNLYASWWMLKVRNHQSRLADSIARLLLNIAVFYLFISQELVLAAIATILLFGVFLYDYSLSKKNPGIVWDVLIEKDITRMRTFYRIANMFTDVPHLRNQIKKRHWLVGLLTKRVPFRKENTFDYLYRITTVRSGDYLGMYIRLIVIGGLAVYFVPNLWVKVAFSILFLYLSGFQMMTLWQHHRTTVWIDLYPVKKEWRQNAVIGWLLRLLLFQTLLFCLLFIILGNLTGMIIVLAGGLLFSYLFVHGYVKKRLT
ncbi:ABC transporter permease [Sediminibacillus massiliensis]|uniref:ABC transporter permease n=1 Tax=Sediminibacillus massiliensis TaxID=1926277 RepID=UPI000988388B|nr:ABC transporter permease [Sediminibacillus massiliensis]